MGNESDSEFAAGLRELKITKRNAHAKGNAVPVKGTEAEGLEAQSVSKEPKSAEYPQKQNTTPILAQSQPADVDERDEASDSESSQDWAAVPAISSYDLYNSSGELAIKAECVPKLQRDVQRCPAPVAAGQQSPQKRMSTFGYTKVADEGQAQRSQATNKKTEFLFNHKLLNGSNRSLNGAGPRNDSFDEFEDPDESTNELNPENQLSFTKNLLSDKEKFAYVGSVSVLADELCTHLALVCLCTNLTGRKKLAQNLQKLQKDMGQWKSTILQRLYEHMDISPEEIRMVQGLASHGVALEDLCKCLKVSQVVENPWEQNSEKKTQTPDLRETDVNNPPPSEILPPIDLKKEAELKIDVAWTILCDLFLLLLADTNYDARSRTLLIKFAEVMKISHNEVCEFERRIIDALDMEQSTEEQVWNEDEHMKTRRKKNKRRKLYYVGLATIGGSVVLGLSGGLLAPVIGAGIAAGLSTAGITGATGFLTGVGGTAIVAGTSTAIGAKIGTQAMSKRMGSVRTFEFSPLHNNRRVNLIVSVSGWMTGNEDDVRLPFSTVDPVEGDLYSLHWEPEMLKSTGQTINILASEIFTQTLQQILGATILTAFMSAIQMPMMLSKLGYIIDNPWNVSLDRAWAAGLILADTLISRNLGQRPVTLIGFSLGARVIYSCLIELCKRNAAGLVENVFIFGSPVVFNKEELVMARSVVSGRFVSGYSEKDWILCYLFRATGGGFKSVLGISAISGIEGVENSNCTEFVEGHMAYRKNMPKLLKKMGLSVLSEEFVDIEEAADPEEVQRQRKMIHEIDEAQKKMSSRKKRNSWMPKWMKPKKAKWQEMCEESAMNYETNPEKDYCEVAEGSRNKDKSDEALVNTSALMKELNSIKQALAADPAAASKKHDERSYTHDSDSTAPNEIKEGENKLQLLSAGTIVLPEDEVSYRKKKSEPVSFAFSDDF
ncbi:LAQU0S06e05050g1_1 [Lachancea quebecensis]|uniref:LAQU0S06e05050g1_1 n=1 Tax=Lachancea quebecensis TaxID=1654605 RepID=A0A0P1L0X3_9SACH|nr:LAQU0S06e05050g1_1 [Lachancea quebecensis]